MNRINPLYIGLILVLILIFVSVNLNSAKDDLREAKISFKETKDLAVEVTEFKKVYANAKKTRQSLERILKLVSLKSAKIEVNKTKNSMSLSSKSMDKRALNSLMGKLLNGSYNIEKLKIKKLSNEKVSLFVEIKW